MMGQSASSFLSYYFNPLKIPVEMLVADSFANYDPLAALEILKVLTDELKIDYKFEKLIQEVKKFQSSIQSSESQLTDTREELNPDTHFFL